MTEMLTTQAQCWKALVDGKTIISESSGIMYKLVDDRLRWYDDAQNTWEISSGTFAGDRVNMQIYEQPKWFDDLHNNPILCMCSTSFSSKSYIQLIVSYKDNLFYSENNAGWTYAIPLTMNDVKRYIYQGNVNEQV